MGSPLNRLILGVLFCSLSLLSWGAARGPIVIAGGDLNGVYFQIAGEFCRLASLDNPDLLCSVMPSAGSTENLQLLREGLVNLALVQGDLLYWAQRGEGPYQGRAIPQLRSVMATHAEPLTLMVLSTQTANLASLQGKKLYLGAEHSGSRTTALLVLKQLGLPNVEQQEVVVDDPMTALCEQQIAAWAMVIGHPNKQVLDTAKRCAIRFVPILPRNTPGRPKSTPFIESAKYLAVSTPGC